MCGCRGGSTANARNQTRANLNLKTARRAFAPVPTAPVPTPVNPNANFIAPPSKPPATAEDRRRIQRLHQLAIRRSLGHP